MGLNRSDIQSVIIDICSNFPFLARWLPVCHPGRTKLWIKGLVMKIGGHVINKNTSHPMNIKGSVMSGEHTMDQFIGFSDNESVDSADLNADFTILGGLAKIGSLIPQPR